MSRPTTNFHSTTNDDMTYSQPPQRPHVSNPGQTPLASASPPYSSNNHGRGGGLDVGRAQHDLHNTENHREAAVIPSVNDPYRQNHQNQAPVIPGVNDPYRDNEGGSGCYSQDPNVHAGIGVGSQGPHQDTHHGGGIGNSSMVGKLQRIAGDVIGNPGMKEKGAMKEREAQRSMELAEAQRLEREAALHRERATQIGRGEQPSYTV